MSRQSAASLGAVVVAIVATSLVSNLGAGQAPTAGAKTWTPPRTPDGQPDLQGVWNFSTLTPLERPNGLEERLFYTDEETAKFEDEKNRSENRDLIDPKVGGGIYPPESEGGVVAYNEFWYDRGSQAVGRRTSLIVDPPDGRLPSLTPESARAAAARAERAREADPGRIYADSYEDRPLGERCIVGFNSGPPMIPNMYNNNVQLYQTPGYVVILNEMIHNARIVPLDERTGLPPHVRQWAGDSRGRWESDTLVVDTTNFYRGTVRGSSANTHLIERFTRVNADTLLYEFTVDDPTTWTRPWTAQIVMTKSPDQIYEYACHEGNYALPNILAGVRSAERAEGDRIRR